jgi:hypothetical protein
MLMEKRYTGIHLLTVAAFVGFGLLGTIGLAAFLITGRFLLWVPWTTPGTPYSTMPLRGGSMTLRAGYLDTSCPRRPCHTKIEKFDIELIDVAKIPSAGPAVLLPSFSIRPGSSHPWIMHVYGHKSTKINDPSSNGVMICSNPDCSLTEPSSEIVVQPEGNGQFYSDESLSDDGVPGLRFHDPAAATGIDSDVAERASVIKIEIGDGKDLDSPKPGGHSRTYTYLCPNGDCVIDIGKLPWWW